VTITKKGKLALQKALPLWRQARNHVEKAIGSRDLDTLNGLLDLAATGVSRSMP
jgi:DNA-binding MarR family transcriptional regulator